MRCRLQIQQIVAGALELDTLLAHDGNATAHPEDVTITLNIGDAEPVSLQTASNGSTLAVRVSPDMAGGSPSNATALAAPPDASIVTVVVVLRNLQRSFLEVRALLQPSVQQVDTIMAEHAAVAGPPVPAVTIEVPWARRLQQSPAVPVFGVISAAAMALATCGNGVCEFGEATGTWAYPENWHCPRDCPYAMHACPLQVRPDPDHPLLP